MSYTVRYTEKRWYKAGNKYEAAYEILNDAGEVVDWVWDNEPNVQERVNKRMAELNNVPKFAVGTVVGNTGSLRVGVVVPPQHIEPNHVWFRPDGEMMAFHDKPEKFVKYTSKFLAGDKVTNGKFIGKVVHSKVRTLGRVDVRWNETTLANELESALIPAPKPKFNRGDVVRCDGRSGIVEDAPEGFALRVNATYVRFDTGCVFVPEDKCELAPKFAVDVLVKWQDEKNVVHYGYTIETPSGLYCAPGHMFVMCIDGKRSKHDMAKLFVAKPEVGQVWWDPYTKIKYLLCNIFCGHEFVAVGLKGSGRWKNPGSIEWAVSGLELLATSLDAMQPTTPYVGFNVDGVLEVLDSALAGRTHHNQPTMYTAMRSKIDKHVEQRVRDAMPKDSMSSDTALGMVQLIINGTPRDGQSKTYAAMQAMIEQYAANRTAGTFLHPTVMKLLRQVTRGINVDTRSPHELSLLDSMARELRDLKAPRFVPVFNGNWCIWDTKQKHFLVSFIESQKHPTFDEVTTRCKELNKC